MPSKRKKNKRRMRRVSYLKPSHPPLQAQRRALEEQHAANPPVKASRGIAVSAPPAGTTKKAAKAPAPEKISQPILVAVPIVETPKLEPIAEPVVEPIPVEVQAPEAVLLEQIPAEVEIEVPAPVTEEAPVVETPSVEPSTVEAAIVQEPEPEIPETEPATEVIPPSEAPVVAPSETEIHTVDSAVIKTETQQTEDVYEAQDEVDAAALAERDTATEAAVEVAVTEDIAAPKPVTEASEKTAVEALGSDRVSAEAEAAPDKVVTETAAESVVEVITDVPEHGRLTEAAVGPAAPAAEEDGKELPAEEDAPAETAVKTEHAPAESVEMPAVPDTNPEAPVQEAEANEGTVAALLAASPLDEFVVTASVSAVEVATESAAVQQEILPTSDISSTQTGSMDVATSGAEPSAAPAKEMVIDPAEPTRLDGPSEESKSETCDLQCQMQISVESVQLNSVEMPVETALNAHIVPEVSIEG
ncbi:fibrous sheath CABYR-binding protein-like isoform X1 [Archocentrus centrarchus]|uniref:fibrous sheath CABYR-binding protein-like isoform X1 n=1 Tax=Archocentrus centrarchus TaxID=63155 RepID=UPI0011EA0A27|nr:fibrous sheath CABYR-binding protein-like isoform X1 [Archocentrus centrarchus]